MEEKELSQPVSESDTEEEKSTERGGASMTITEPSGTMSTKCSVSFGAVLLDDSTILTVYAGPHILVSDEEVDGENMWMSGIWPPCGRPSLRSASDISQLEYWDKFALPDVVDMARKDG